MTYVPFNSKKYRTKYRNDGSVKKYGLFLNETTTTQVSRLPPSFKWFQPTRTITNSVLDDLTNRYGTINEGGFEFILNKNQLPSMLYDKSSVSSNACSLLKRKKESTENFFKIMKRKINVGDLSFLSSNESIKTSDVNEEEFSGKGSETSKKYSLNFKKKLKGQSSRIFAELYKVIDCSSVLLHIVDARDPLGTFNQQVFNYIKLSTSKPVAIILNKVDLIPTSVTIKWLKYFKDKYDIPILPFNACSLTNFYGKEGLMNLLRQYSKLFRKTGEHDLFSRKNYSKNTSKKKTEDTKINLKLKKNVKFKVLNNQNNLESVTIGIIGMPNVGKSSIINILSMKKSCKVAPIAGETKYLQYISLSKNFYLLDCPGIVGEMNFKSAVKRGAVRIEKLNENEIIEGFYYVLDEWGVRRELERVYKINFYLKNGKLESESDGKENNNLMNEDIDRNAENTSNILNNKNILNTESINTAISDAILNIKPKKVLEEKSKVDIERFINDFGIRFGKLKKKGEVSEFTVCQIILNDYLRGRISFYSLPPEN